MFMLGRFVGIAWEHGDSFMYYTWTGPTDTKARGWELIRNVVQACHDPTTFSLKVLSQVTFDFICADRLSCRSISITHPHPCNNSPTSLTNGPSPKCVHFNDETVFYCPDSLLQGSGCLDEGILLWMESQ